MVEKVFLDTDVLITILENSDAFAQVKGKFLMTSIVSAYEFLFGEVYLGRDVHQVKKNFETIVDIIGINQSTLTKTISIDVTLTKRGEKLQFRDLIIGATAITYNVPLVTKNLQHFERLHEFGLQLATLDDLK